MKSKKILLLLCLFYILCTSIFASSTNIPIYVHQKLINSSETPAYISSGRTFIPVRAVGNVLNLNVDWQSPNVILSGKHQVTGKSLTISINTKTNRVVLNNAVLTNCIEIKDSRSYITLRVLAEAFGYVVDWKNKCVYISSPSTNHINGSGNNVSDNNHSNNNSSNNSDSNNNTISSQTSFENQVLSLVNTERAKKGLSALTMDENLRNAARLKSDDMYQNKYFSHTSPTYGSPFDMLKTLGISYQAAAENIAQGYTTPESVVNGWMNSSGHRANILNGTYTHIGIGYNSNGHYWTQLFIKP